MFLVDSHCHLDYFKENQDEIIKNANNLGVQRILTIGTKLLDSDDLISIAEQYDCVFASVGLHPEYACNDDAKNMTLHSFDKYVNHPKVVALGECGLDYFYGAEETYNQQRQVFEIHLKAAKNNNLPIIIHSRNAEEDTISLLKQEYNNNLTGVLHCFSSNESLAEAGLDMGFYMSASGIITFKKSDELRNIFKKIPLDKLLVETDSPYLAPMPYRGKQNEPAYVVKTAEVLADIKGISVEKLAEITTENFFNLFKKAK